MPVDRMIGFPLERVWRSSPSSVRQAEAILYARRIESIDEIDGGLVPARGEPENLHVVAIAVDSLVLLDSKFESALQVPIGLPERALARPASSSGE